MLVTTVAKSDCRVKLVVALLVLLLVSMSFCAVSVALIALEPSVVPV